MRISDWSSDVCSSDLPCWRRRFPAHARSSGVPRPGRGIYPLRHGLRQAGPPRRSEERRVGKECVVRVDLGGRRIIKKKKLHTHTIRTYKTLHIKKGNTQ